MPFEVWIESIFESFAEFLHVHIVQFCSHINTRFYLSNTIFTRCDFDIISIALLINVILFVILYPVSS